MAMTRVLGVVVVAGMAASGCTQALKLMKDDSAVVLAQHTIDAPNPAEPGPYTVKTLFYGSGTDKQRPEFRTGVSIKTKTVDVSPFATVTGTAAKQRKEFWGFDLKKAPLKGRVWYPDGPGPWPLALIVHGNHNWREFSDPGYAYLGELLASRGIITVSVDENFINGLSAENDGRAWLLLKHLEVWKTFNETEGGPFHRKLNMDHEMETGQRKDSSGKLVPAHYISNVTVTHAGKTVLAAEWGPGVAKNPYLQFRFKGGKKGDEITVTWVDNKGETRTDKATIG